MKGVNHALALLALACVSPSAEAAESYDNCTGFIASVPTTISTQGTWCMDRNLATAVASGAAITIATNDVTLDCNDFKLTGTAALGTTNAVGIVAANRHNLRVRNCSVRGFRTGLRLVGSGHLVEDSRFVGNGFMGLEVHGDGSLVRGNLVLDTGGSTLDAYRKSGYGVLTGDNVDIVDNTIDGVNPVGDASGRRWSTGIRTANNLAGTVSGNRVRSLVASGGGIEVGIDNIGNDAVVMSDNIVNGRGTPGSYGLRCADPSGVSVRNVVLRFPNGLGGCADGGGNVVGD